MNNLIVSQIKQQSKRAGADKISWEEVPGCSNRGVLDLSGRGLRNGIAMSVILGDAVSRKRHKRSLREHL